MPQPIDTIIKRNSTSRRSWGQPSNQRDAEAKNDPESLGGPNSVSVDTINSLPYDPEDDKLIQEGPSSGHVPPRSHDE